MIIQNQDRSYLWRCSFNFPQLLSGLVQKRGDSRIEKRHYFGAFWSLELKGDKSPESAKKGGSQPFWTSPESNWGKLNKDLPYCRINKYCQTRFIFTQKKEGLLNGKFGPDIFLEFISIYLFCHKQNRYSTHLTRVINL